MDFVIDRSHLCKVTVGETESDAVKIAAENLKKDLAKVFGEDIVWEEGGAGIKAASPEKSMHTKAAPAEIHIHTATAAEIMECEALHCLFDQERRPRREAYLLRVQEGGLYIIGTERRGTVYGIYDLCEQLGVSPWYFWADVPVKEKQSFVLKESYEKCDYPTVEYRGIFINDEEELEVWVRNYMAEPTIGVKTYERVFELLLRLKGNYIWPAMHVNSFNVRKENGALAEKMGIVVGTSHCDMLMRSNNREWKPWIEAKGYQGVAYDYSLPGRNREILKEYWRESVEQNKDFEVCYTLGMRGIHDSGFETKALAKLTGEKLQAAKIALLQQVMADQQEILRTTLGHDTMMTFVPYKEVLPLYDGGLEIPEDITLVWANDNYGYIRRYPSEKERCRKGGNGIYYHNSYWAPPSMSYVFLCSIPLAHTAYELRKAYGEGVRKLWVINTGAMKPLEQEIEFFLRLAWEIDKEEPGLTSDVDAYVENWINRNFSGNIGKETAELLNAFSQLTNVRKLENMDYDAFSQVAYGDEAAVRIHAYEELFEKGNAIYRQLPEREKDAFFQMVLMRIHAAYFTNLQYYYGDRSTLMYDYGCMQAAAEYTRRALAASDARRKMVYYYNNLMAEGKWRGIVNPEGFPPPRAAMMPICTPPLEIKGSGMTVHLWNQDKELHFTKPGVKFLEIGNLGREGISYKIEAPQWLELSQDQGTVDTEVRILIKTLCADRFRQGEIAIHNLSDDSVVKVPVTVSLDHAAAPNVEEDGVIAVNADTAVSPAFRRIKRLGRGRGNLVEACVSGEPFSGRRIPDGCTDTAAELPLSYQFTLLSDCQPLLEIHRFPSLNSTGRIRIGVSVDDAPVTMVETEANDEWRGNWKKNVLNNVDRLYLKLPCMKAGKHSISFYAADQYFAFSRFVIYTKERKENNYIGVAGDHSLPAEFDADKFANEFYGDIALLPRPVEFAQPEKETDTLTAADCIKQDQEYAPGISPSFYLELGRKPFTEGRHGIRIDAASVLGESAYAYAEGKLWRHCAGESYGRTGLAMYIRKPELRWESCQEAPSLNYRIYCRGGEYVLWLLAKFDIKEESFFGVGIDGKPLSKEELYNSGCLWRYESEQIYRWVPLGKRLLCEGEHMISLYSLASGLRFDRIYITAGEELPPMDSQWQSVH